MNRGRFGKVVAYLSRRQNMLRHINRIPARSVLNVETDILISDDRTRRYPRVCDSVKRSREGGVAISGRPYGPRQNRQSRGSTSECRDRARRTSAWPSKKSRRSASKRKCVIRSRSSCGEDRSEGAKRERMTHFRLDAERRLFLLGHALVRLALSRHSDVDPRDWRFCLGPYGRPEISTPPSRLRFTLSHTRGLAACAVVRDQDIGLDVEDTSCGDAIDVAKHVLSPRVVYATTLLHPLPFNPGAFSKHRMLKEAYMKARGFGLSLPFDRFSFYRDRRGAWRIAFAPSFNDDPRRWWFRSWR